MQKKIFRKIIEFLLYFTLPHLRFPPPYEVEVVVLLPPPFNKVEKVVLRPRPPHKVGGDFYPTPPHEVKELVLDALQPRKVKTKEISLQNY